MTISALELAIFAMDAYNRGYGNGLDLNQPKIGGGKEILLYDITDPANGLITFDKYQEWQAAGFYAVAYEIDGEIVISYRGTDNLFGSLWSDDSGSDIWNSYGTGAGSPMNGQAGLAAEFYQAELEFGGHNT